MESSKKDCCKGDCDPLEKERTNYFTGRHLSARDFQDEQEHHRTHRFLHNRILHGWGVVCGLKVEEHNQADCRDRYVKVSPGMAIDCCGREIVVDCAICCGDEQDRIPWDDYNPARPYLLLCLCYEDKGIKPVPVLTSEGDCSSAKPETKYARLKESWKLKWKWIARDDLRKYEWRPQYGICPPPREDDGDRQETDEAETALRHSPAQHQAHPDTPEQQQTEEEPWEHYHPNVHPNPDCPHDDCDDPCDEGFRSCVTVCCPPEHCVPLALICARPGKPIVNSQIVMRGRPQLPDSPQKLTRIIDINWEHGGVVPSSWFEKNTLLVTFDRKLREAGNTDYPGPYGVNQATFVVEYGGGTGFEDLDFVPSASPPSLNADGLIAEYEVRPEGSRYRYSYLEKHVIWISIKCDFLLDCHGVRVDGNDNGVAGGTFESWFYVVSDSEYERMRREEDYENTEEEEEPARRQNPEPPRRAADYRQTLRDNQQRQSREGR